MPIPIRHLQAVVFDFIYEDFVTSVPLGPIAVEYSFALDPSHTDPTITSFNAEQRAAVRQIFDNISSFTQLTFQEVSQPAGMMFMNRDLVSAGRWQGTFLPYAHLYSRDFGWVEVDLNYTSTAPGRFSYELLLHEIGHGLGLSHPHGQSIILPPSYDSTLFTVMSYVDNDNFKAEYMLYDIAALQFLYGRNMDYNISNDSYVLQSASQLLDIVWDARGIDEINASLVKRGLTIDLRAGRFTSFLENNALTGPERVELLGIAYGTLIENAKGTGFSDSIFGNNVANLLLADVGSDRVQGLGGNDILFGQAGNDTLKGGAGRDYISGGLGRDVLTGNQHSDRFFYASISESSVAGSATDIITDFAKGEDRIDLSVIDYDTQEPGDQSFHFIGSQDFFDEGQMRCVQINSDTLLEINVRDSHSAEMVIRLRNVMSDELTVSDFIL